MSSDLVPGEEEHADTREAAVAKEHTDLRSPARSAMFADVEPVPGSAKPDPILTVDKIDRNFGGLKAVDVSHLEVQQGAITALFGQTGGGGDDFFFVSSDMVTRVLH